jgi:hypothetical protein
VAAATFSILVNAADRKRIINDILEYGREQMLKSVHGLEVIDRLDFCARSFRQFGRPMPNDFF